MSVADFRLGGVSFIFSGVTMVVEDMAPGIGCHGRFALSSLTEAIFEKWLSTSPYISIALELMSFG